MKIYDCSVLAGGEAIVTNELGVKIPVTDAVLNALGEKPSEGKLIISEEFAVYIVNTQPDLKELLGQVKSIVEQLSALCDIGVSRSPDSSPLAPAIKIEIEAIKTQLEGFKLI